MYTDEQYKDTRAREISMELMDFLSTGIDKSYFISTYNDVKQQVLKKRLERRMQQKVLMASAEGAVIKERKRTRKAEKKKEKKKEKKLHYELRKN